MSALHCCCLHPTRMHSIEETAGILCYQTAGSFRCHMHQAVRMEDNVEDEELFEVECFLNTRKMVSLNIYTSYFNV